MRAETLAGLPTDPDAARAAKADYDVAAAEWQTHGLSCAACSILFGAGCAEGERLLSAENDSWSAYWTARYGGGG